MPALNFMKRFVPSVESGLKRHSIRAERKRQWKIGDSLALYTGMRQKGCTLIGRTKNNRRDLEIWVNGEILSNSERNALAWRDGFQVAPDMARFWITTHKLPFAGHIIHWAFPLERKDK